MYRDYYALWLRFKHSDESLSQFAKQVGIPKSTLSVAFRAIGQVEDRVSLLESEVRRLREELQRCYEEMEAQKGLGGFLKRLVGG